MKYLVAFTAITIAIVITGCTKSSQQPTHFEIMTSHTWYLKNQTIDNIGENAPCNLSEELTFSKDSTGNHFYPVLCTANQPSNVSFDWYIEDNTNVGNYYTGAILTTTLFNNHIGGKADSSNVLRLFIISEDTLGIEGIIDVGQNYRAIYTSVK